MAKSDSTSTFENIMQAIQDNAAISYLSPRISPDPANRMLSKEAQNAVATLSDFLGYEGTCSHGKFRKNSPFQRLVTGKSETASLKNTGLSITRKQVQEAQRSVRVYRDDSMTPAALQTALIVKQTSDGAYKKVETPLWEVVQNAGRKVVISTDYIFTGTDFRPLPSLVRCKTVAACAPILKEGSSLSHRAHYVTAGKLNAAYRAEMMARVKLILASQLAAGVTIPVIAPIGAGDFAGGLDAQCAKILAECLREHLETGHYSQCKGVVLSAILPIHKAPFDEAMKGYKGTVPCAVTSKEMTGIALAIAQAGEVPGLLIADHPLCRTGNAWAMDKDGRGARAQEETMTKHLAMFIGAQDHELNPAVLDPAHHQLAPDLSLSPLLNPWQLLGDLLAAIFDKKKWFSTIKGLKATLTDATDPSKRIVVESQFKGFEITGGAGTEKTVVDTALLLKARVEQKNKLPATIEIDASNEQAAITFLAKTGNSAFMGSLSAVYFSAEIQQNLNVDKAAMQERVQRILTAVQKMTEPQSRPKITA